MTAIANDACVGWPDLTDDELRLRELEETLEPMVRLALRKGLGVPEVVQWVQRTYVALTEGVAPASPEFYVPQITRLLCVQWQ
ncbi:MAG TPA: hypothetical protein VKS79_08265 [Gemmataceae bacterium]|nr:hypothetical protein [Gemmataceae bacterium]